MIYVLALIVYMCICCVLEDVNDNTILRVTKCLTSTATLLVRLVRLDEFCNAVQLLRGRLGCERGTIGEGGVASFPGFIALGTR